MSMESCRQQPGKIHCLSIDVEEHFQVSAFESPMRRRHWDQFESRVQRNVGRLLDLFAERGVRATFFVLGWVAERNPGLVGDLVKAGHEIASHGYGHAMITAQTQAQFREDVRKTKAILEDIAGKTVFGYRAPSFSITSDTMWALTILVEEGYAYDSSIFPVLHNSYGVTGANPHVHQLTTSEGPIWEVPPTTVKVAGLRLPAAGGGYLRLLPFPFFQYLLRRAEKEEQPLVIYLHPWEIDPRQPRMRGSLLSRFRHYHNLHKAESRLLHLLQSYRFAPIRDVIPPIRLLFEQRESPDRAGVPKQSRLARLKLA